MTSSTPKEIHDSLARDLKARDDRMARVTDEVADVLSRDGVTGVDWAIQRLVQLLGEKSARAEVASRLDVIREPSIYGLRKADPDD